MEKMLALFMLLVSMNTFSDDVKLKQFFESFPFGAEVQPNMVRDWLSENSGRSREANQKKSFDHGLQMKERKNWGAAAKSFGDSVMFYPTSRGFIERSEAFLKMNREKNEGKNFENSSSIDIFRTVDLWYRNALAADDAEPQLSKKERLEILNNVECLNFYIEKKQISIDCDPLKMYGLSK